jgi:hypothetical protein
LDRGWIVNNINLSRAIKRGVRKWHHLIGGHFFGRDF